MSHLLPWGDASEYRNMKKLQAENARLKADAQVILKHLDEASADCARLKAEVERLRKDSEYERKYREVLAILKQHNL